MLLTSEMSSHPLTKLMGRMPVSMIFGGAQIGWLGITGRLERKLQKRSGKQDETTVAFYATPYINFFF